MAARFGRFTTGGLASASKVKSDWLKVVRIDRLARSVSHLLEVIETLEKKGAHFRSHRDPIDTTTSQAARDLILDPH